MVYLEKVKRAQEITDKAFSVILGKIEEGMSEGRLRDLLEAEFFNSGVKPDELAFPSIVAFQENAVEPHAIPSYDRKLRAGDLILMDFGVKSDGWCSDMTRTVAFKSIGKKESDVYEKVLASNKAGIKAIKAGVYAEDIHRKCTEALEEYKEFFIHGTGHGVGKEVHEPPYLSKKARNLPEGATQAEIESYPGTPLKAGQIVTIEPGVYIPEEFGIRIEDMVLVTEDGCINLTKSKKELIII